MTPLLTGVFASQITGKLNVFTPSSSYDALATYTVPAGGVSSVTFSGLPTGGQYTHLQLRVSGLYSANNVEVLMSFNGDTNNSNYTRHYLYGQGTSALAGAEVNTGNPRSFAYSGTASSTTPAPAIIDILDYASNAKRKVSRVLVGRDFNGSGVAGLTSMLWNVTPVAITDITISASTGSFNQHSNISLYGVRG